MSVWAIVVARVRNDPKSRLAAVLDYDQRQQLALAMLADVLSVCASATSPLDHVLAVVDSPNAAALAGRLGVAAFHDNGGDMNLAVRIGINVALRSRAQAVIVLPGDIPLLQVADLDALLAAAAGQARAVVVGASRDGHGTNALLLRPPDVIEPAFGPPSVERHVSLGESADAVPKVVSNLGLSLDVDTPADLAALVDLPVGPTTARLLGVSLALSQAR